VFTHAAATDGREAGLRPVDLWKSPDWLTPFGASEVAAVELGTVGTPGPAGDDLYDAVSARPDAVEAVLAAVATSYERNRPLVLAGDPETVVAWLRVISRLTSAAVASQIPFTTFVRAAEISARSQFEIIGVPTEDLAALLHSIDLPQMLVLNLDDLPDEKTGTAWAYAGQTWTGGERWQDAFYGLVNGDRAEFEAAVASMDEISATLHLADLISPDWPLVLAAFRQAGPDHPDAEEIRLAWSRSDHAGHLGDPVLQELLADPAPVLMAAEGKPAEDTPGVVEAVLEPVPEEAPDEPPAPVLEELLEMARTATKPDAWEHLLLTISQTRPRPVTWDEYPLLCRRARNVESTVAFRTNQVKVREAITVWLRVAPILAVLDNLDGAARFVAEDAALLCLGICRPEDAGAVHVELVDLLLHDSLLQAPPLTDLLDAWTVRYEKTQGTAVGQGSE
jgi:hypothetical protein